MSTRPPRWSWTTMWAAAIVVLLPTLAWLQYSWLDQIAIADRDRRERTVRTAAAQLAQEFDLELSKAFFALQIDNAMLDQPGWVAYATRYASWSSSAANPRMIRAVYLAGAPQANASPASPLQLQRWDPAAQRFDPTEWPAEMQKLAARLREHLDLIGNPALLRRGEGPPRALMRPDDDPATMVAPIVHVDEPSESMRRPPNIRAVGFTIMHLDIDVLKAEILPAVVRRHFFDEAGQSDFRVAVVEEEDQQQVVFESEAGAASAALDRPDATTSLMSAHNRPFLMFARGERNLAFARRHDQLPPEPGGERLVVDIIAQRLDGRAPGLQARMGVINSGIDGHWRLVAKHRAGSLEAAVTSARTRNFALSSGVLLLLSAAVGLIVVSARRADRLGRQQMEFVATVSHELRTPVSVIGAAAGNLADGLVADPSRVKQYGDTIQTEARRLAETVERVLQLAGIASGRAMSAVTLTPRSLVADAIDACRAEIDAAGFEIEVDVPDHLPMICGDRTALGSAMQNLIGNAVKYGRDARWVRVSARVAGAVGRSEGGRPELGRRAVEISIADRGPGIPADDRPHIFEAFYRGRHAVAHQIQGNGLGLHLVQRIVNAHGGRVTVDYDASPGCRFTITLPAVDPPAASEQSRTHDALRHEPSTADPAFETGQSH